MIFEIVTVSITLLSGISPLPKIFDSLVKNEVISPVPISAGKTVSLSAIPTPTPTNTPSPTSTPTLTPTQTPTPLPTSMPTPTPTISSSPGDIDSFFSKYSSHYSVSGDLLRKIALCESGYNPSAKNGIYEGMFQFSESSWISARSRMGEDVNLGLRNNAEESIKTASFMLSTGGQNAWVNCL